MFITQTIPGYSEDLRNGKENDWICVEDLCSSYCAALNGESLNVCAWYNKVTGLTHFGGQWAYDVPAFNFGGEPTEKQVWDYAAKFSYICKRMAANARKDAAWKANWDKIDKDFEKNGVNFVYVILEKDGEQKKIKQPIGNRTFWDAYRIVMGNLTSKESKFYGNKLKKFIFRNYPQAESEKWRNGETEWDLDSEFKQIKKTKRVKKA